MIFDIYKEVLKRRIEHKSHDVDLHIPVNEETTKIIENFHFKATVEEFKDQDGRNWFNIPFAYSPKMMKTHVREAEDELE